MIGQLDGLQNPLVMTKKREAEAALIQARSPRKELTEAYASIAQARKLQIPATEFKLLEEGWGFNSVCCSRRGAWSGWRRNARCPTANVFLITTKRASNRWKCGYFSPAPISAQFEKMKLTRSLQLLEQELGEKHPAVKLALNGKKPEERAARWLAARRWVTLQREKTRCRGRERHQASTDPMIVLAPA